MKPQTHSSEINTHAFLSPASTNQQSGKVYSRVSRLWFVAEELKTENDVLEEVLGSLIKRVIHETAIAERHLVNPLLEQTNRLVTFASRKSLTQSHRLILLEWIDSNTNKLSRLGVLDDNLLKRLTELETEQRDLIIDPYSQYSTADQIHWALYEWEQFEASNWSVESIDWYDDRNSEQRLSSEQYEPDTDRLEDEVIQTKELDSPTRKINSVHAEKERDPQIFLNKLFRRVARVIHPNKEAGLKQKRHKRLLMANLLECRRQKDVITLMKFYRGYVDDAASFDQWELIQLEDNLIQFIELEMEKQLHITLQSTMHTIVHQQFYDKNPEKVEKAISKYIKNIEKEKVGIERFLKTVTSLKTLRPHLKKRFSQGIPIHYRS